jgi:hypothetical protein
MRGDVTWYRVLRTEQWIDLQLMTPCSEFDRKLRIGRSDCIKNAQWTIEMGSIKGYGYGARVRVQPGFKELEHTSPKIEVRWDGTVRTLIPRV